MQNEHRAERFARAVGRPSWQRWLAACVVGCATGAAWPPTYLLAAPAPTPSGTSSRVAKEEAAAEIPFDRLKPDVRKKLLGVMEKPSIYRRLPEKAVACDADMYLFLIRNPDVVVNIWELMGVTNVKLKRVGDFRFDCSDGAGTDGVVELVYGTRDLHVFYATASYEGPLTGKKTNGQGVILLKSKYMEDKQGKSQIETRLDVFVRIDQLGADLIAKTLQPMVGKAADMNFQESSVFVSRIQQAAETNPAGVQRLADKLKNVPADARAEFAEIAMAVGEKAAARPVVPATATKPTKNTNQPALKPAQVR